MRYIVWLLIAALVLLHQDYWGWGNTTLDLGFLPRGLSYHIGISLAAAILWWLATAYCWPIDDSNPSSQETDA